MRYVVLFSSLGLAACLPDSGVDPSVLPVFEPVEDPYMDMDGAYEGELSRVTVDGALRRFSADTSEGWGRAGTFTDGFYFDVRGEGSGVLMNMAFVQGHRVGDLLVGDRLDAGLEMVGCAGDVEDEWSVDEGAKDTVVEVIDATDELWILQYEAVFADGDVSRGVAAVPRHVAD